MNWESFESSLAFMLIAMPAFGALLTCAATWTGNESVRMTVLINTLLTLFVSVVIVISYDVPESHTATKTLTQNKPSDSGPQLIQFESHLRWLGQRRITIVEKEDDGATTKRSIQRIHGPNIQFAFGIDGINLWFILLCNLLVVVCVLANWRTEGASPAAFFAWILLLQAGVNGALAALDIVVFYLFLEWTILPVTFLLGLFGGEGRRTMAKRYVAFQLVGSLFVFLGLMGIVVAYSMMRSSGGTVPRSNFSIQQLTEMIPQWTAASENALEYWQFLGPWLLLALLIGFGIKSCIIPFHAWFRTSVETSARVPAILLSAIVVKLGLYGIIRFLIPLFAEFLLQLQPLLTPLLVCTALIASLRLFTDDSTRKLVASLTIIDLNIAILAAISMNAIGVIGAILLAVAHGIAIALLQLIIVENSSGEQIEGTVPTTSKWLSIPYFVAILTLMGIPLLAIFPARWMTLLGIFNYAPGIGPSSISFILLAMLCPTLVCIALARRLWNPPDEAFKPRLENKQTTTAIVILVVVILACGLFPQALIRRIEPSVAHALEPYDDYVDKLMESSESSSRQGDEPSHSSGL
ncbi:MAG: hypothetical protein CMJ78_01570 [Planctomycetaceae bacterium]|nr:hypothetical protein [Planctomycetaceae bacterium]